LDQFVAKALVQHGVDPALVEFEITETAFLEHSVANVGVIERLSKLGCQISLDDFGTGYSSIISLQKMPISVVKIDRSIMPANAGDESNKRLTTALVVMVHYLGMESVAEGVETAEQHAFCESLSIDRIQGYYRSKPLVLNDEVMERLLKNQTTP
jgi:EAL domain-containing protein (putative c-di-GMP-specific phosphodiesterase class I)